MISLSAFQVSDKNIIPLNGAHHHVSQAMNLIFALLQSAILNGIYAGSGLFLA